MPEGNRPDAASGPADTHAMRSPRALLQRARSGMRRRVRGLYGKVAREEMLAITSLQAVGASLELAVDELGVAVDRVGGRVWAPASDPEVGRFLTAAASEFGPTREVRLRELQEHARLLDEFASPAESAIDLGCGRGEWLELLGQRGMQASGVDHDAEMVAECRERGLSASTGDGLDHIAGLADGTTSLVSALRLIEHLAVADLLELVANARRVLRPGGVLLIEAPDPRVPATQVGLSLDPTTPRARHPELIAFCARHCGFDDVAIHGLAPEGARVATFLLLARN